MRKHLLAVSALAACAAIDVASAGETPPLPADTWDGGYVGVNVGGSFGRARDTTNLGVPPVLFSSTSSKLDGVIGGDQVGYNWHSGNWLLGLEADIQGSSERGTATTSVPPGFGGTLAGTLAPSITLSDQEKLVWFGTVRARTGILATPTWLLYATGGLAYGGIHSNEIVTTVVPVPAGFAAIGATTVAANLNTTKAGYAAGGGVEGVVSGNLTVKLEYLFMDFGTFTNNFAPIPQSTHVTDNIIRVGLNYHLH